MPSSASGLWKGAEKSFWKTPDEQTSRSWTRGGNDAPSNSYDRWAEKLETKRELSPKGEWTPLIIDRSRVELGTGSGRKRRNTSQEWGSLRWKNRQSWRDSSSQASPKHRRDVIAPWIDRWAPLEWSARRRAAWSSQKLTEDLLDFDTLFRSGTQGTKNSGWKKFFPKNQVLQKLFDSFWEYACPRIRLGLFIQEII